MYVCPKSLCDERSYARHPRYFAASDSLRSDTPINSRWPPEAQRRGISERSPITGVLPSNVSGSGSGAWHRARVAG